jgi:nucleolar protein 14
VLYRLLKFDVNFAARCVRAILKQKRAQYAKHKHDAPGFATIALIQLVSDLFPTSDLWHPVCTPTLALACEIVGHTRITSINVCAQIIFLSTLLIKWVSESKRYLPEVVAFLHGALKLAIAVEEEEPFPTMAFPVSLPHRQMLHINSPSGIDVSDPLSVSQVFSHSSMDETADDISQKVRVLRTLFSAIYQLSLVYSAHDESFCSIFGYEAIFCWV